MAPRKNSQPFSIYAQKAAFVRAGKWLTQSETILRSSEPISILDCSSVLQPLSSLLFSPGAFSGFPYSNMACFLVSRDE